MHTFIKRFRQEQTLRQRYRTEDERGPSVEHKVKGSGCGEHEETVP